MRGMGRGGGEGEDVRREEGLRAFHSLLGGDGEAEGEGEGEGREEEVAWEVARDSMLDAARDRRKMTAKDRARVGKGEGKEEQKGEEVWVVERKEEVEVLEVSSGSEADDDIGVMGPADEDEALHYISISEGEEDDDDGVDTPRMYDLHSDGAFVDLT